MYIELLTQSGLNSAFYAKVKKIDENGKAIHIKYVTHKHNKPVIVRESIKRDSIVRMRELY